MMPGGKGGRLNATLPKPRDKTYPALLKKRERGGGKRRKGGSVVVVVIA